MIINTIFGKVKNYYKKRWIKFLISHYSKQSNKIRTRFNIMNECFNLHLDKEILKLNKIFVNSYRKYGNLEDCMFVSLKNKNGKYIHFIRSYDEDVDYYEKGYGKSIILTENKYFFIENWTSKIANKMNFLVDKDISQQSYKYNTYMSIFEGSYFKYDLKHGLCDDDFHIYNNFVYRRNYFWKNKELI